MVYIVPTTQLKHSKNRAFVRENRGSPNELVRAPADSSLGVQPTESRRYLSLLGLKHARRAAILYRRMCLFITLAACRC